MSAPTGSLFDTNSPKIQEIINKNIDVLLPMEDPFYRDMIVSSQGVESADKFGRDWKMLKLFQGSLTGVIEGGGARVDFGLYGDNQNTDIGEKIYTQGLAQTFPDPLLGANPAPYRLGIPMRSMVSNLLVTMGEMEADVHDPVIGQLMSQKLLGHARHWAIQLCLYWYLSQNLNYQISTLGGGAGTGWDKTQDTNTTLMVDTTYTNYAVDRFHVGMRVQIYDSTGATLRQTASLTTSTSFFVTAVDSLTGKVYFKATDGLAVNGASFADGDIIVFAGSKGSASTPYAASPYFTGIAGMNSYLKFGSGGNDNYILGAERDTANTINVVTHPEFKSMGVAAGGIPLTEHFLRKALRRFHVAKGKYGHYIDTLLASDGVWLAYQAQRIGREYIDRTNMLASLRQQGSSNGEKMRDEIVFTFDGKTYHGHTSSYVESGTLYGIRKGGNNYKRFVPKDYGGLTPSKDIPAHVPFRFVAPALTGTQSLRIPTPIVSGTRTYLTEGSQMPGMLRMQIAPDQVTGLKITGLTEDRMYSDN